jgi:hypothetical protein
MPPAVRTAFEKQHRIFNRLKEQNDFLVADISKVLTPTLTFPYWFLILPSVVIARNNRGA